MDAIKYLPPLLLEKYQTTFNNLPDRKQTAQIGAPFAASLREFLEISGSERQLAAGEVLFMQDDSAYDMYWIESGAVAVLQGEIDQPRLLAFRYPGQVVGEIALIENIQRTATVAAVFPTRLKALSKEKFQAVLTLIPGVGIELLRLLSSRLREIQPAEYSAGLYDHLTGALSRQTFDRHLRDEIELACMYGYSFSLVFIDLDKFKEVNDQYGHLHGDKVLVTLVQHIRAALRTTDLLFRYGGDEFVLLLQGIDHERGPALIQRVLDTAGHAFQNLDPPVKVSFSAGLAYFPLDSEDPDTLLKIADERAYRAKSEGRARVVSVNVIDEF